MGLPRTGQGTATRSARALTEASLAIDDNDFVQISHTPSNGASGAVAERVGFVNVTAEDDQIVATRRHSREKLPHDSAIK